MLVDSIHNKKKHFSLSTYTISQNFALLFDRCRSILLKKSRGLEIMNRQQLSDRHQQYYDQNYGGDNNSGKDGDSLWDDVVDEDPIETFPVPISHPLSPSSSISTTGSDVEEQSRLRRRLCQQRSDDTDADDYAFEKSVVSDNNYDGSRNNDFGRTCSSSSLSSNPDGAAASEKHPSNDEDDDDDDDEDDDSSEGLSVLEKIENFILQTVIEPLSEEPIPAVPELDVEIDSIGFKRKLSFHNLSQARSLTSIILVASFCYDLLAPPAMLDEDCGDEEDRANDDDANGVTTMDAHRRRPHHHRLPPRKTTTTREVYYFYVTYFRDQRECDNAIWDLVRILNLPSRQSLGLVASPRGWFCGSIDVYNARTNELRFNGRELDSHGMAITPSTYDNPFHSCDGTDRAGGNSSWDAGPACAEDANAIRIESDARCILVIEKEGIYTRLSEDKFFLRYFPCILVTGRGFPDIATRRWVWRMKRTLNIPVYGLW